MKLYYVMHPNATKVDYSARRRKLHKIKTNDYSVCNCVIDRVGIDTASVFDKNYLLNRGEDWLCGNCFTKAEKHQIIKELERQGDISSSEGK